MPVIPSVALPISPVPTAAHPYPWRFAPGDEVYVLGRAPEETFKVIGGELWLSFPHLHAVDTAGKTWRLPQIHCSSKPIVFRKG